MRRVHLHSRVAPLLAFGAMPPNEGIHGSDSLPTGDGERRVKSAAF